MDIYQEADQLRKVPMLAGFDDSQLRLIAFTSDALHFHDGDYLFMQNQPSDSVYVLMEGEVDVVISVEDGHEVVISTLQENQMVGEMAVFRESPRSASVRAKGDVKTLKIPNERFLKLITDNPQIAIHVMRQMSERLFQTTELAASYHNQNR